MRWEDERYVRIYTRDTADWLALSFDAQALFVLLLRKIDRAGLLPLGKHGNRSVAAVLGQGALWPRLEPALEELLADGCIRIEGSTLVVPNFIEAQEAAMSDRQRKAEQRARARDQAAPPRDDPSRNVTECHEPVTPGHAASQEVTPNCAVPCRAVPISPSPPASAREQGAADRLTVLAPRPLTASILAELEARGFECGFATKATTCDAIERALGAVGVSTAADRVMAKVTADRKASVVPHATLGWYLDDIRGRPEGGHRPRNQQSNPQTGVAVPADASAFGEGGQRAIE